MFGNGTGSDAETKAFFSFALMHPPPECGCSAKKPHFSFSPVGFVGVCVCFVLFCFALHHGREHTAKKI